MIYPEFPKEGSYIGICPTSCGVGYKLEYFDMSMEVLAEEGFGIFETDSVRNDCCPAAPAEVRAAEFNSLFADDDIAMVFSASGGDYAEEMLPLIDRDLVRSHPKWFAGYSDPTTVEMLLTTVFDIATIYGVNAGAWDWRPLHEFQYNALSVLKGELPVQHSYDMYNSTGFNDETGQFDMDAPVEWLLFKGGPAVAEESEDDAGAWPQQYELHQEYQLDVTGRLIGGCIDVIDAMIGTPFEDLKGFADRYAGDGFIWFFDNFELKPMGLMYAMLKMKQMGLFSNARAVVFGRTCFPGEATDLDYLEQLERVFADTGIPLIWNADIGHTKPSFTIVNGSIGHLTFDNGYAELSMELK